MKKGIILFASVAALFLSSCAETNVVKAEMESAKLIRGTWTLTDVNYSGLSNNEIQGNKKITETVATVFDTASPECYVGSTWNLVQNNKSGTYDLNNGSSECPSGTSKIIWNITKDGSDEYFTFKDVTGIKAKQNTAGYKLKVEYADATSLQLVQDVNAGGKIAQVIYTFQR